MLPAVPASVSVWQRARLGEEELLASTGSPGRPRSAGGRLGRRRPGLAASASSAGWSGWSCRRRRVVVVGMIGRRGLGRPGRPPALAEVRGARRLAGDEEEGERREEQPRYRPGNAGRARGTTTPRGARKDEAGASEKRRAGIRVSASSTRRDATTGPAPRPATARAAPASARSPRAASSRAPHAPSGPTRRSPGRWVDPVRELHPAVVATPGSTLESANATPWNVL